MADICDLADKRIEEMHADAMKKIVVPDNSIIATHCECGIEIHPRRAAIGYKDCIGCASANERHARLHA